MAGPHVDRSVGSLGASVSGYLCARGGARCLLFVKSCWRFPILSHVDKSNNTRRLTIDKPQMMPLGVMTALHKSIKSSSGRRGVVVGWSACGRKVVVGLCQSHLL